MYNFFLRCFLILSLVTGIVITSNAQEDNPLPYTSKESVYDMAPQFPGGPDAMHKYFTEHVQYPEPEKSKMIQGDVMLKFIVTKKGKIINVAPINGVPGGPNLVKEAIRLVLLMPDWIPATKNGKKVETEYNLSIPFRL